MKMLTYFKHERHSSMKSLVISMVSHSGQGGKEADKQYEDVWSLLCLVR